MSDAWESFDRAATALVEEEIETAKLRALLRELAAEIRPILDMNTRDLGGILCGAGGGHRQWLMEKAISHVLLLLRRAEAEAGEEKDDLCPE